MLALENADEILQILDRFTKQKSKDIPPELEEYINYVAKTGDTVYRWPTVQYLFREKLRNVIKEFHDTTASIEDLPQCPNVDQFNYESMKTLLFERFDNFQAAPFTVQRLCELLTDPKKHYTRLDKFMRALEKNILVVSTVEPGRKTIESDENGDISYNDDLLPDINIEIEINKNDEKRPTNGTTDKHNEINTNEHVTKEVASSSGISSASVDIEVKKEDVEKTEEQISEKPVEPEKPTESSEQQKPKEEVEVKVTESTVETVEAVETKPTELVEAIEQAVAATEENVIASPAEKDSTVVETNADSTETVSAEPEVKMEAIEEAKIASVEENKIEEDTNKTLPAEESVESEKPPTPKHARSTSDDEDGDGDVDTGLKNPCAKKIRLELDEKAPAEPKSDPEPTIEPIVPEVDLQKKTDITDSLSTEIDAQKENELLEDVVDAVLVAEKDPINIDVQPIAEKVVETEGQKPSTEEKPATEDLLKPDEPVAIPTDLDFTPDEALNELVSSDILSVIPEQPAEEVKMNVENTETNTSEAENAMEAAPIKTDEEQMDVDESNSVDAMDL